jgi:hypothetical protein
MLTSMAKLLAFHWTAATLSRLTHENWFWQVAAMGEEIPLLGFMPNGVVPLAPELMCDLREKYAALDVGEEVEA